jgi:hypothetical protein
MGPDHGYSKITVRAAYGTQFFGAFFFAVGGGYRDILTKINVDPLVSSSLSWLSCSTGPCRSLRIFGSLETLLSLRYPCLPDCLHGYVTQVKRDKDCKFLR